MNNNLALSHKLTYSTVRIETDVAVGTGFFFAFLFQDGYLPVIVTNNHVVKGALRGKFHVRLISPHENAPCVPCEVEAFPRRWIAHPDPSIDLCVMPVGPLLEQINERGEDLDYIMLDSSMIPSDLEFSQYKAMQEVVMIGYPNGIWDNVNNQPIVRRGITATHPSVAYRGRPEFLIDAAVFGGSSGSPVLMVNGEPTSQNGQGEKYTSTKLLGVLYAGPVYTVDGNLVVQEIPSSNGVISVSEIPMNLGCVIRSNKLLDFAPLLMSMLGKDISEIG